MKRETFYRKGKPEDLEMADGTRWVVADPIDRIHVQRMFAMDPVVTDDFGIDSHIIHIRSGRKIRAKRSK